MTYLLVIRSNHGPVSNHFRDGDVGRKSEFFCHPVYLTAPLGWFSWNFVTVVGLKNKTVPLPDVGKL